MIKINLSRFIIDWGIASIFIFMVTFVPLFLISIKFPIFDVLNLSFLIFIGLIEFVLVGVLSFVSSIEDEEDKFSTKKGGKE